MSGGRRIDDHSFWAGSKGKASVFPDGMHKEKHERTADSDGHLANYEDTTEKIRDQQELAKRKAQSLRQKPLHRN